ncbi:isoaspartyl peptidase/L-asparaginase [Curvibacter sp. CHRR-16]|uniref:isoaspartyl peptidase/L-asparaginase family protein n=1 Tax=Curvibacter sp. CHRR-16 TaxID=2835872 RepID=UPI001BD98395|nr:isoaspartyl peptidase/L-asparaginase [Curvibacter sp. CHRR-16]MBT0570680.1 isoaspartyl peptidase/L-asparaginase [Curvibacter sp. CHRR-16]
MKKDKQVTSYALAVHGGAGTIKPGNPEVEAAYHAALQAAVLAGEQVLQAGGSALQAVTASVQSLEDCPLFNAGHGAVFNANAEHELDASIMDGQTLKAGAVAGMRTLRNPVLGALAVMKDERCVLVGVHGEAALAAQHALEQVEQSYFSTEARREQLRTVQAHAGNRAVLDHDALTVSKSDSRFGTVGAVALDQSGNLAAATSTGGMTNKMPGRIGDTPVVGAGVYANNASCAVSATGTGEQFLRACLAHDIHARMVYAGSPLDAAAAQALSETVAPLGGVGGLVAIDRDGNVSMPYNSKGMYRAWVREGQSIQSAIFADVQTAGSP